MVKKKEAKLMRLKEKVNSLGPTEQEVEQAGVDGHNSDCGSTVT